jgi:serine/threonine-protein kinase
VTAHPDVPADGRRPTVLAGRYELGELLGAGGSGRVYRGVDLLLGRPVAVKVLARPAGVAPADGADDGAARLRREARAIAALDHPNVVGVHDVGWTAGALYIVMEHVGGTTLAALIRERGRFAVAEVVAVGEQVCAALEAVHRAGGVHRDVSPGNILVRPDGRVKLTDFGIARVATGSTITATGLVVGTPAYMSPEQVRGNPVDGRSDLYSAGCCLYAMLTGHPPFGEDGAVETAHRHLGESPPPPSAVRPDLPPPLEHVVLTALAKDPRHRHQDAGAMRRALLACPVTSPGPPGTGGTQRAEPGPHPPDGAEQVEERLQGWGRRRLGVVLIVLSVAVLLAVAALVLVRQLAG